MRGIGTRPPGRSGWRLLSRCWPVAVLIIAGLVVLGSPALQALLVGLIWVSWLLVGFLALRAGGLRVPSGTRRRVSRRARWLAEDAVFAMQRWGRSCTEWRRRAGGGAGAAVRVQARRLRSRVQGEDRAARSARPRRRGEWS